MAMADHNDQERNYPATARRLEQARERGQVARSRELTAAAVTFAAAIALTFAGGNLWSRAADAFAHGLRLERADAFDSSRMAAALVEQGGAMLLALAPLFVLVLAATLAAPLLMSGWIFSARALTPDFARLNPRNGLSNLWSKKALAELGKALLKCALLGTIGGAVLWYHRAEIIGLVSQEAAAGSAALAAIARTGLYALAGALALIAAVDVPLALWRHYSALRMTREELREEMREMEGDPQQKARVAMRASRAERQILMRDHNAEVLNALLNHPRIEEGEVLEVVKSPHTNSAIMKRVADNKKWMGNQDIRIAVVRSPKTPTPLAIKHLPALPITELQTLSKMGNAREVLRKEALKLYLQRRGKGG